MGSENPMFWLSVHVEWQAEKGWIENEHQIFCHIAARRGVQIQYVVHVVVTKERAQATDCVFVRVDLQGR